MTLQTTPVAGTTTAAASTAVAVPAVASAPIVPAPEKQMAEIEARSKAAIEKVQADAQRAVREATERINAVTGYHERRYKSLESALRTAQGKLQELDPGAGDAIRLAQYETEAQIRAQQDTESMTQRQQQEHFASVMSDLQTFVAENGIDVKDARLDWGDGAKTYPELYRRVQVSVAKINKENVSKIQAELDAKLKEAEQRIKKELGFDSVDTTSPGGASGEQDYKRLMKAFADNPHDPQIQKAFFEARKRRGI
jgi:hypothetical protein